SNLYDGIFFGASNTSTISDITISGNTISDVENDGIAVGATGTSTLTRATITGNHVSNVGRFGIGVGVDTPIDGLSLAASSGSTVSNAAVTNNSIDGAGVKAGATTSGGNIGIAVEDSTNGSNVCVNVSGNTSTNPPSGVLSSASILGSGGLSLVDLYLQNARTPTNFSATINTANFKIVNRDTIPSNNNFTNTSVSILIPNIPPPPFFASTTVLASGADNVSSCP
ncbi:MAG: hypothetical protein J7647_32805, partial [Cyanobacteria bacterium SBLK]|nr:hypothetical protein [Cyanobacteria bacterium SBLK]